MNQLAFGVLLVSSFQVISAQLYHGYLIAPGAGVQPSVQADNLEDCLKLCDAQCSAVSYHKYFGYCVLTKCGNVELQRRKHWVTVTPRSLVLAGDTVPRATHEWAMTDQCGVRSVGSFRTPSLIDDGFDYVNSRSKLFGNALYFPNKQPNTGKALVSLPDASLSSYAPSNVGFSVSLYINFNTLPPNACLFEYSIPNSYAWHFWLWPSIQTLYANLIVPPGDNQSLQKSTNNGIKAGVWHHIVFSFDPTANALNTYLDGNHVGYQFVAGNNKRLSNQVLIGGRAANNIGFFDGSMYCLSVYNQTLTQSEVLELKRACVDGKLTFI